MFNESLKIDGFDGKFSHIAIVVHDIEKTISLYCQLLGIERPVLKMTGEPDQAKVEFMGRATPARSYQAFFDVNGIRVELMQPDENESTWRDALDAYSESFHHAAYTVDNMEKTVELFAAVGIPVVQTGFYNGGQYVYLDSRKSMGMMIELLCSN
ncbi:MAG: VOC family protein [Saccharofermentanales bacterium]|jgi:methylmalonyl-CoA/ethylmalonyl-CoA epimerase